MQDLVEMFITTLKTILQDGGFKKPDGEIVPYSSDFLNVVRQFIKDNPNVSEETIVGNTDLPFFKSVVGGRK